MYLFLTVVVVFCRTIYSISSSGERKIENYFQKYVDPLGGGGGGGVVWFLLFVCLFVFVHLYIFPGFFFFFFSFFLLSKTLLY